MSISSTGIYGNTSILNSEIYTDIINDIEDINTNKIPTLILDISQNRFDISSNLTKINDLSNNRIVIIEQDINDISSNKIPDLILDISKNTLDINDISTNKIPDLILDVSKNTLDINDISLNKIPDLILDVGFSSLLKQNKKGKNCAVFCFAGKRKILFIYYAVIVKQKIYKRPTIQ